MKLCTAFVLGLALPSFAQERLLPALDYAKKTPDEWMSDFAEDDARSPEPLWCLYWSDARTPEVIEFLESWRTKLPDQRPLPTLTPPPRNVGREIEEILTQWHVDFEPMVPQWSPQRDGEVLHELDDMLKMAVAQPNTPVDPKTVWYRAPSGLFPYPTRLLSESDARLVERLSSGDPEELSSAAVTLIVRRREMSRALRALVRATAKLGPYVPNADHEGSAHTNDTAWRSSSRLERDPWTVQAFEIQHLPEFALQWATGVTDSLGANVLVQMIEGSDEEAQAVSLAEQRGTLRLSSAAWEKLADARARKGGHPFPPDMQGSANPVVRKPVDPASLSFLDDIGTPSGDAVSHSRCERVLRAGEAVRLALVQGEPIDEKVRPLVAELRVPYREGGAIGPDDWYMHALRVIATLRLSTPDVADACVDVLLDKEHFSSHVDRCVEILSWCTLSARQRALAVQMDDTFVAEPYSAFFATLGPVGIERAARLRTHAQAWNDIGVLADVLRISRPHPHDLEMVAAALDRGFVSDRNVAISILEERKDLDTPDLRRALVAACDDIDDVVRAGAKRVRTQRAW